MTMTSTPATMEKFPDGVLLTWKERFELLERFKRSLLLEIYREFGVRLDYFSVKTKEGFGVLHLVFTDLYIPYSWLSMTWCRLTGAHRVNIELPSGDTHKCAGYFSSQYLSSQDCCFTYSMSHDWIYPGWSHDYKIFKDSCRDYSDYQTFDSNGFTVGYYPVRTDVFVKSWDMWLSTGLHAQNDLATVVVGSGCGHVDSSLSDSLLYGESFAGMCLGSDLSGLTRYLIKEATEGMHFVIGGHAVDVILIRR
jgi:hypothetical protein